MENPENLQKGKFFVPTESNRKTNSLKPVLSLPNDQFLQRKQNNEKSRAVRRTRFLPTVTGKKNTQQERWNHEMFDTNET